jgi:hypothetical protein
LKGNFKRISGVINPQSETKIYSAYFTRLDIWPFQLQALYYTTKYKAPIKPVIF